MILNNEDYNPIINGLYLQYSKFAGQENLTPEQLQEANKIRDLAQMLQVSYFNRQSIQWDS